MESIFAYTDYRVYLKDYFAFKKTQSSNFSLKIIADRAGFKARDYFLRVMNGTRNLSQSGCFKLSEALQLSEKETEYFINLVSFNQAQTPREKEFFYLKMSEICKHGKQQKLRNDQFEYFSEWYYSALRSLLPVINFKNDFNAIGKFLSPPLSAAQVEKAINFLLDLKLLESDNSGHYHVATSQIAAGDEVTSVALMRFYKQTLELTRRALEISPSDERDITGVTMSLSRQGFEKIRDELAALRKKVMYIAEQDFNEEQVFQLNLHLFPMSKRRLIS